MGSVYVMDTEWTDRDAPQIIEAAWIRMPQASDLAGPSDRIDLHVLSPYQSFEERYCPSKAISFSAMAVHHILPQELINCPPHTTFVLPSDAEYLIGHSIDGDWEAAGSPEGVKRICTHALAQHIFSECDSMSLSALLYYTYGATDYARTLTKQAHGAMADCWNVLHLLRKVLEKRPDIQTWPELWAFSEECRVPLKMPLGQNRGALLTDLETSEINWYLVRDFIDPYLRKGLEKVLEQRYPARQSPAPECAFTAADDSEPF